MLTLSEAAKETGLTRSGIFKAIKAGKVSATKDDNGHFQIDPAELFRVYSRINAGNVASEQRETAEERQETGENKVLQAKIEVMGQLLRQVESERDDLRRRLDVEGEERRKLTALLTHQREPPEADDPRPAPKRSDERLGLLWSALTVLVWVAMLGAIAFGLAVWWPSLSQP